MRTITKKSILMQSLLSKGDFTIPKKGDTIEAKIVSIKPTGVYLDLEKFKTGIILGREIKTNAKTFKNLKPGDTINVKVTNLENEDGYIETSFKKAGEEKRLKLSQHLEHQRLSAKNYPPTG